MKIPVVHRRSTAGPFFRPEEAPTNLRSDILTTYSRILGFTAIELLIVVVFLGILSAFAVLKAMPRAGESTAGYQAQRLASDLGHTQMLAMAWGKELVFTSAQNSYKVTCKTVVVSPCPPSTMSPVVDPGRSDTFVVILDNVTLNNTSLTFDIVGKPLSAASFIVSADGVTMATVTVAANTGFATVQ